MTSDILLIIATICLVILTAGLIGLFMLAFRVLKDMRDIVRVVRHEADFIAHDVHEFRQKLKARAGGTVRLANLIRASGMAYSTLRWISARKSREPRAAVRLIRSRRYSDPSNRE